MTPLNFDGGTYIINCGNFCVKLHAKLFIWNKLFIREAAKKVVPIIEKNPCFETFEDKKKFRWPLSSRGGGEGLNDLDISGKLFFSFP